MKKVLLSVAIMLGVTSIYAQTKQKTVQNDSAIRIDSMLQANNAWLEHIELVIYTHFFSWIQKQELSNKFNGL